MIGALGLQILTGFLRTQALEAKHSNFSTLHRVSELHGVIFARTTAASVVGYYI